MSLVLGLLYLLLPAACWAFVVRTRVVGVTVFTVLTGLAVALVGLEDDWYFTRATAEIEAGYPLVCGLVILAGGLAERRLRGPRPKKESNDPAVGAAVALTAHALVGCVIGVGYQLLGFEAFLPDAGELSLPPGLTVVSETDGYCGSNFCSRTLLVGSTTGLPPAEVAARLRAALAADGWTPGPRNTLRRPHGWLLDGRLSDISIGEDPRGAAVDLAGSEIDAGSGRP
ncbi:hypothetical protein ACFVHB_05400 [Kitasatospora sp. NPDC127111]|uniref:hypothetical protein n=1 Tax=Kitasatospora sp. NPDC127111 TaxID=3345363 RepID=UPI00363FF7F1